MVLTFWAWLGAIVVHGLEVAPWMFGEALWDSTALEYAGMGFVILGTALALAALWTMGRSWRIGIDEQAREALVTTGVFSISRNPIFVFFDLLAIGMACMSGTVFFLASSLIVVAATHVQILREEKHLRRRFGDEYDRYCRRVRRYL